MIQSEKAENVRKTNWNHSHHHRYHWRAQWSVLHSSFLCFVSSICMSFVHVSWFVSLNYLCKNCNLCHLCRKKWHDKWSDIKGAVCIENGQKTFFNWITNILILCYPSKQALTLSISSVKLTIDRIVSLVIPGWRLSSVGNFMEFMEILSPGYPAYLGFVPLFTVTISHRGRRIFNWFPKYREYASSDMLRFRVRFHIYINVKAC